MKHKKIARKLLWTLGGIFLLMNIMAGFHAWKFTHFDPAVKNRTEKQTRYFFCPKTGPAVYRPKSAPALQYR